MKEMKPVAVNTVNWSVVASCINRKMREKGLTCQDVEDLSGLSHSTVDRLRKGAVKDPGFNTLITLCHALEIKLPELLDGALLDEDVLGCNVDEIGQPRFQTQLCTGLTTDTLEQLNLADSVNNGSYIAELLDDSDFIWSLERELSGIAYSATRLYKLRRNAWWSDAVKEGGLNIEKERKKPNVAISSGMYSTELSIRERLNKFMEQYISGKGKHTHELIIRGKNNGNDPQENK